MWTDGHVQSFAVRYDYPVHFTRDMFDPANVCFARTLSRREAGKRHRLAIFVDGGLSGALPNYFQAWRASSFPAAKRSRISAIVSRKYCAAFPSAASIGIRLSL
jgi:hypothetical protein